MNINDMRRIVIRGQIATLKEQILTWEIYHSRTDEDVSVVTSAINEQITALTAELGRIPSGN